MNREKDPGPFASMPIVMSDGIDEVMALVWDLKVNTGER